MRPVLLALFVLAGCGGGSSGGFSNQPTAEDQNTLTSSNNGALPLPATCEATLVWERPYDRQDGTPFTPEEILQYTIYISHQDSTKDSAVITIIEVDVSDNPSVEAITIDGISKGQKYFYMTITDKDNRVSSFSNILNKHC
jgi:hypothetical protein